MNAPEPATPPLLSSCGLKKTHGQGARTVVAVDGVDLAVHDGERVAVVGESGAGKKTLLRLLARLQDPDEGAVEFVGVDVTRRASTAMGALRRHVQLVFPDPATALHPLLSVGALVEEGLHIHGLHPTERSARVAALLAAVGLDGGVVGRRPGSLSGGQRRRVALARALAVEPRVLLLDEPTAGLDVTAVARVVNELNALSTTRGLALLFVTHDLHVVRHLGTRALVLYAGRVVEEGPVEALWSAPQHPYTRALFAAQPRAVGRSDERGAPRVVAAAPPTATTPTTASIWVRGCAYAARCAEASVACRQDEAPWVTIGVARRVRCHARVELEDRRASAAGP